MKEFIEKLIGRLEEKFKYNSEQAEIWRSGSDKDSYSRGQKDLYMDRSNTYGEVMRMVNQLAEEYNNGWIACSERLPEDDMDVLVKYDVERYGIAWYQKNFGWDSEDIQNSIYRLNVIAWQPIAPYQPKGE